MNRLSPSAGQIDTYHSITPCSSLTPSPPFTAPFACSAKLVGTDVCIHR